MWYPPNPNNRENNLKNWQISKNITENNGGRFITILHSVFTEGRPNLSHMNINNSNLKEIFENYKSLYSEI